jgi:hypothetical protein
MARVRHFVIQIVSIFSLTLLLVTQLSAGLIHDGSFENNPSGWTEYFNSSCTISGLGNWTGTAGLTGNYEGSRSLWLGGLCNNGVRNNGVRQTITLGPDAAVLSLWYAPYKGSVDVLNQDQVRVLINDDEVWMLTVNGPTGTAVWQNALIDISQYAGQEISLAVEMDQNAVPLFIANVFIDFVEVYNPAVQISQQIVPPNVFLGDSFTVEIAIQNSGDVTLNDLAVSNKAFTSCDRAVGSLPNLAPGENTSYTCTVENATLGMENNASVLATATDLAHPVEAESIISPNVVDARLELVVQPNAVTVEEGEAVTLELGVTNNGLTTLTDIELTADPTVCAFSRNNLTPGQTAVFICTFTPTASGKISFVVTAVEPLTNTKLSAETAAVIEVNPVEPPTIDTFTVYLPLALNNVTTHNSLGEPNNSCAQSFPITVNQSAQFLAEDIDDWYSFNVNSSGSLTINLTNFAPIAGQITVWRGSCGNLTFLGQNGDFATTKVINLGSQPPGSYFIWIINDGPTNTNQKYTLTVLKP